MSIVRLAKVTDYVPFEQEGLGLFYIPWEPRMGPGNPTDDPKKGVALFNDWQCARAAGKEPPHDPAQQLEKIIDWVVEHHNEPGARRIAKEIVRVSRDSEAFFNLDANADDYPGQAFTLRCDLAFLNSSVRALPSEIVFKLNCL